MQRLQKAALSLHAMQDGDRDWMLGQLPVTQRDRLTSMLDELEELGVPREPVLLDDVAATVTGPPARHPLADADATAMQVLLAREPDAVAIALLSGAQWPWAAQVLDGFRAAGRDGIEAAVANSRARVPDRAFEALCDAALLALEQLMADGFSGLVDQTPARRWRLLEKFKWRR